MLGEAKILINIILCCIHQTRIINHEWDTPRFYINAQSEEVWLSVRSGVLD